MSSSNAMEKSPSIFHIARARQSPSQNLEDLMQTLSVAEQKSTLCLLPYEIRMMIYRFVLCSEQVLALEAKVPEDSYSTQLDLVKLTTKDVGDGILRTCRLFYREAAHLLYSGNTFSFGEHNLSSFLYGLLDTISPHNAAAIRTLSIYFIGETLAHLAYGIAADSNPLSQACGWLPGLQELVVWRPYDDFKLAYSCRNSPDARLDTYLEDSRLWTYRLLTAALQNAMERLPIKTIPACRIFLESKDEYVRLILDDRAPAIRMNEAEVWPAKDSKFEVLMSFSQLKAILGGRYVRNVTRRLQVQSLIDEFDEMPRKSILDRFIWEAPGDRVVN
ncbi:hypothetical protein MMC18_003992 [Xylographa bjoerkii]|nr:hypothetical protein [Xylographa bjoerkii]